MKNQSGIRNFILAAALPILPFTTSAAVWTTTVQYGERWLVNNGLLAEGSVGKREYGVEIICRPAPALDMNDGK